MSVAEKKVRKTITLSPKVVKDLEMLAKIYNKTQSSLIEELIEKEVKEIEKERKIEAFERLKKYRKYFKGVAKDKTFQELKTEMGEDFDDN
jgi:predicted DNA-binding protein